jgi:hypothetical protein
LVEFYRLKLTINERTLRRRVRRTSRGVEDPEQEYRRWLQEQRAAEWR